MIQHISPRKTSTAIAPMRQPVSDNPEQWGKWIGRHYYSLEMVQHPLRARMCGFGDKDRRPLAPAAVAKMVVKREDNSILDVDDIDVSFFLVTVDLWSEDGKHERNLVLHPSSGERYVPVQAAAAKPRRRGTSSSVPAPPSQSGHQTPILRSTPTPSQYRGGEPPTNAGGPMASGTGYSGGSQGYYSTPQSPMVGPVAFSPSSPYSHAQAPTWGYSTQADRNQTYPPPILPSIHSFGRTSSPAGDAWSTADSEPTYRGWNTDPTFENYGHTPIDSSLKSASEGRESSNAPWEQQGGGAYSSPSTPQYDPALYTPTSYSHQPQPQQPVPYFSSTSSNAYHTPSTPSAAAPSTSAGAALPPVAGPRSAYTRTLVGPLSSNGYRLLDEHRKPGIFFLFQDLSVRTEGTFRLRLRLMNVGAPPAPEPGALAVHTNVSPVLAQIFSEPFTVYSAKRFPGVPETTALSIAFGNQGLKLPLRNRHGSSKRRRDSDSDDSDG